MQTLLEQLRQHSLEDRATCLRALVADLRVAVTLEARPCEIVCAELRQAERLLEIVERTLSHPEKVTKLPSVGESA